MGVPQPFQYFRAGGITAFIFLSVRQSQFIKQGFPQLFGGIDIEFISHRIIYLALHFHELYLYGRPIFPDSPLVYGKPDAFHVSQYFGQGQLNIP